MFKLVFGVLGLLIALAVGSSLMKNQLGALGKIGQPATRADKAVTRGASAAPTPQPQGAQRSVFERTDEAWRQSEQRYRRSDP